MDYLLSYFKSPKEDPLKLYYEGYKKGSYLVKYDVSLFDDYPEKDKLKE